MFKRIVDEVSRYLVGGLFIFSGLIKLNDPIGTRIKMEEYFEVFAEDFGSFFEYFIPYALEIGMIMIILEIVLGVAVFVERFDSLLLRHGHRGPNEVELASATWGTNPASVLSVIITKDSPLHSTRVPARPDPGGFQ